MRAEAVATVGELPDEAGDGPAAASRAGEERLRVALAAGRMGVWSWDLATGRQEWDVNACRLFGLEPGAEVTRADFIRIVHPDDRAYLEAASARALAEPGTAVECEFRVVVGGEVRWLASRAETIVGPDGGATGRGGRGGGSGSTGTSPRRSGPRTPCGPATSCSTSRSGRPASGSGTTTSRPRRSGARRSSSGCSASSRPRDGCRSSRFARPATRRTAGGRGRRWRGPWPRGRSGTRRSAG